MGHKCFLTWGDWLSCDHLRESHDSQSPHIWGDWLSCSSSRNFTDIKKSNRLICQTIQGGNIK